MPTLTPPAPALLPDRATARWQPTALALMLHVGLLTAVYSALYCFGVINRLPTNENLLSWDVQDLLNVARNGYPDATKGYNAFFPLMPLVWRYTGLNLLGASLLNAGLGLTGLFVLARTFRLHGRQVLVVASAPLMLFTLVPYTEGFFFFFGALLVRGLHRQRLPLTLLGLLGCGLTRSAVTLFVPAYVFAELLAWGESSSGRVALRNIGAGLAALAGSVGAVMLMQGRQNGDPLAFFKVHALWGHILRWPIFPFNTTAGPKMLWLDAGCLVVALLALGACAVLGVRWLGQRRRGPVQLGVSKAVLFALAYCAGAAFFVVFYQAGDLVGMSRYVMGTVFFGVLLAWVWRGAWRTRRALTALAATWALVVLGLTLPTGLENFAPGEALWYLGLMGLYLASYWLAGEQRGPWAREVSTGLYFLNMFALCFLLNCFLNRVWVN